VTATERTKCVFGWDCALDRDVTSLNKVGALRGQKKQGPNPAASELTVSWGTGEEKPEGPRVGSGVLGE